MVIMKNSIPGIGRIDREVAVFHVWLDPSLFPVPKMKVRVVERDCGDYKASPNLHVKDRAKGTAEYVCGLGDSIDNAMSDFFKYYLEAIREYSKDGPLLEEDFEWSPPEEF